MPVLILDVADVTFGGPIARGNGSVWGKLDGKGGGTAPAVEADHHEHSSGAGAQAHSHEAPRPAG